MLYKTSWCTLIGVTLAGDADQAVLKTEATEDLQIKEQSTGPLPRITFLPSEHAQTFEDVHPERLTQQIHFALASFPKESKFRCVKFITLDYGHQ